MPRTLRSAALLLAALALPAAAQTVTLYEHVDFAGKSSTAPNAAAAALAGSAAAVHAYLDYRRGADLIVDGQRLVVGPPTKFHGQGDAKSPATIPLGYQVEASGVRRADGAIAVARLDAKPNGQQMFESDVRQATDQLEATWRAGGEMLTAAPDGGTQSLGRMRDSGPQYDRARGLVDRMLPPGEAGKAQNILFGNHSRSSVRAAALEREIALNYPR